MSNFRFRNPSTPVALVLQTEFATDATSAQRRLFAKLLRCRMVRHGHLVATSGCFSVVVPIHPASPRLVCHQIIELLPLLSGVKEAHFIFPVSLRNLLRGDCGDLKDFARCVLPPETGSGPFVQRITEGALLQGVAHLGADRLAARLGESLQSGSREKQMQPTAALPPFTTDASKEFRHGQGR
jgi:hypothetical protein